MGLNDFDYSRFFDIVIDLCIVIDDEYIKKANKAYFELTGWSEEKVYGTPIKDLLHPDDVAETFGKIALLKFRPEISYSCRTMCAGGDYKSISWTGVYDEEKKLMYCTGKDQTEGEMILSQLKIIGEDTSRKITALEHKSSIT